VTERTAGKYLISGCDGKGAWAFGRFISISFSLVEEKTEVAA